MAIPVGWDGNETSTVDYDPFISQNPPAPPIFNYDWGGGKRGGGGLFTRSYEKQKDKKKEGGYNQIGYETDWKYPNWLIRMAQWRNF